MSDKRILEEVEKGDIIINPFNQKNLNTSSYDVTLGEYYYRSDNWRPEGRIYNIYNEKETKEFWGHLVKADIPSKTWKGAASLGISENDKVIVIQPGETILAHTQEFIGGKGHITTMMKARSSMGRQMIAVCKCAGWGDVGYINRWTLEITNYSKYAPIPLVVGRRIAQIVFFETGPILKDDYAKEGKYQETDILADVMKSWKPEDMLPKLWKDRDIKHTANHDNPMSYCEHGLHHRACPKCNVL